ncbi:uncharacterized protein CPUR_05844 [Claviceps purpurea 20.1]|uniref:BZIP domain-containing protein n=1 Tax=Claviceps purpurea (strain 20.1) TaxID=1111077 RepID=M1W2M6_CLAP2|nr:uncharacterized protein CPUR_05844 [Claviceps purpurea 20.1]
MPEVLNPPLPSLKSGVPEANDARWPEVSEGIQDSALWAAAAPRRVEPPPPRRRRLDPQYQGMVGRNVNSILNLQGEQLLVPVDGKTGSEKAGQKRKRNAEASAKSRRNRGKNAIMAEQLQQTEKRLQEAQSTIQEAHSTIREKDELLRQKDEENKQLRQQCEKREPQK